MVYSRVKFGSASLTNMKVLIALVSLMGCSITTARSSFAVRCDVSLPQQSSPECKVLRNAALAQNKKTWTLKHDPALYGFARLNMTPAELQGIVFKDPFTRYYTTAYVQTLQTNEEVLVQYNKNTTGQAINDFSEYLKMSEFFQSVLEPLVGEYARLPSKYEAFINNKTEWIKDKYFTQQRLAGTNPMSIQRVTIHGQEKRRCSVKTTDGRWCHFPFTYRGKVYRKCTDVDNHSPWCSTTEKFIRRNNYGRWGNCAKNNNAKEEADDCSVKTTRGEWCHCPFTYRGKVYDKCTTVDHRRPWCSTTERYKGKWGNCEGKEEKEEEEGVKGLDWNKLNATLNPNFDWEAAVQEALKTDDSLEEAINQGRIYALRYELCDDLARSPDLTDRDPRRKMWNFLSPIALFASAKVPGEYRNELVPVAIQMDYTPDSAVYTPKDGDNWMIAKLNVQITDIGYAQIVEHLGRVHFMIEPFCVILKRTLSYQHPLNQILKYHCRELTVPNTFGVPNLLGESKLTDLLFAYGNDGAYRLLRDTYPLTTWEVTDYRGNIKKRGLDDKKLLPYFPFRDDGYIILGVIEHMVENYVNLYYKQDKDVEDDKELQAYLNELSLNGTGPNGGIGRVQGFPASIDSKEELCEILSRFLSHVTIYHAAVNYVTADYPEYIPNQPTKLYNDTRVADGEFSVYRLTNRLGSAIQNSAFNTLGVFRLDSLFDYGNELQDVKAVNLINGYYSYLMHIVQPRMQEINQKRKEIGDLTYPYFIPKWLPNGIQT